MLAGDAARRWALSQGLKAAATAEEATQVCGGSGRATADGCAGIGDDVISMPLCDACCDSDCHSGLRRCCLLASLLPAVVGDS